MKQAAEEIVKFGKRASIATLKAAFTALSNIVNNMSKALNLAYEMRWVIGTLLILYTVKTIGTEVLIPFVQGIDRVAKTILKETANLGGVVDNTLQSLKEYKMMQSLQTLLLGVVSMATSGSRGGRMLSGAATMGTLGYNGIDMFETSTADTSYIISESMGFQDLLLPLLSRLAAFLGFPNFS